MSLIDELRASRESPATAYLLFLQSQKYGGLHAFMEGDADPSFYRAAILRYYPDTDSVFIYKCGGKKDVYKTREKITTRTETNSSDRFQLIVIYFVDKDLSDILPEHYPVCTDVYITDYYSVENYLVNDFLFDVILTDCFNFTRGTMPDKARFLVLFKEGLETFHSRIMLINVSYG